MSTPIPFFFVGPNTHFQSFPSDSILDEHSLQAYSLGTGVPSMSFVHFSGARTFSRRSPNWPTDLVISQRTYARDHPLRKAYRNVLLCQYQGRLISDDAQGKPCCKNPAPEQLAYVERYQVGLRSERGVLW
jgi:hypothetical protein